MIKRIIERYCDGCGKKIEQGEYSSRLRVLRTAAGDFEDCEELYANGEPVDTDAFDFCKDCMISFNKWRMSRSGAIGETQQT